MKFCNRLTAERSGASYLNALLAFDRCESQCDEVCEVLLNSKVCTGLWLAVPWVVGFGVLSPSPSGPRSWEADQEQGLLPYKV